MRYVLTALISIILSVSCNAPEKKPTITYGFATIIAKGPASEYVTYLPNKDTVLHIPRTVIIPRTVYDTTTVWDSVVHPFKIIIPEPPYARKNLLYDGVFEGSIPAWLNPQSYTPSEIAISTEQARTGKTSIKVTLNKSDKDIGTSRRSEMNRPSTGEPYINGQERWYGVSYFLPNDYIPDIAPEAVYQFHEFTGTASPHFALWTLNSHWYIAIDGKAEKGIDMGTYENNKWTDFAFHIKWSYNTDGFIDVYKAGVLQVPVPANKLSFTGANMPKNDKFMPYLKCGIYKWPWAHNQKSNTTVRTLYIDNLRIANEKATIKDVSP